MVVVLASHFIVRAVAAVVTVPVIIMKLENRQKVARLAPCPLKQRNPRLKPEQSHAVALARRLPRVVAGVVVEPLVVKGRRV